MGRKTADRFEEASRRSSVELSREEIEIVSAIRAVPSRKRRAIMNLVQAIIEDHRTTAFYNEHARQATQRVLAN